jgi:hypothetical protein
MTEMTEIVKNAIKQQYHAALAMLGEAIRLCPDDLWTQGNPPRQFWRLAYHGLFYAQLYMEKDLESFVAWELDRENLAGWDETPRDTTPYTKIELLDYWQKVDEMVDAKIDALDLTLQESGFSWYKNFPKLDHLLLSVRHIQEHAGQLRDRIMERGVEPHWVSRGRVSG